MSDFGYSPDFSLQWSKCVLLCLSDLSVAVARVSVLGKLELWRFLSFQMWPCSLWKGLRVIAVTTKHLKCYPYSSRQELDYISVRKATSESHCWFKCYGMNFVSKCALSACPPGSLSEQSFCCSYRSSVRNKISFFLSPKYFLCNLWIHISKRKLEQLFRQLKEDLCRTESVFSPSWFILSVFYTESKCMSVLFSVCRFYCLLFYNLIACCQCWLPCY